MLPSLCPQSRECKLKQKCRGHRTLDLMLNVIMSQMHESTMGVWGDNTMNFNGLQRDHRNGSAK